MSATSRPAGSILKRILVGRAFTSHKLEHTLLPKSLALPVFASDALSSVAYATGEIFIALAIVSLDFKHFVMPISFAIAALMAIVVASYRQTVRPIRWAAAPTGREGEPGTAPGLVAAAALLVDYTMTVVVSIVAGVFAIGSALPAANEHKVILAIAFVWLVTIANLRGTKESGVLFAIPTYGFVASIMILVGVGLAHVLQRMSGDGARRTDPQRRHGGERDRRVRDPARVLVRATALTGVEAIADGVPAFRRPQAGTPPRRSRSWPCSGSRCSSGSRGSRRTSRDGRERRAVAPRPDRVRGVRRRLRLLRRAVLHGRDPDPGREHRVPGLPPPLVDRRADRFMPSQFMNRGDRLVFSNGIVVLAAASSADLRLRREPHRLIQLYVIGVFTSFTLSHGHGIALRLNKAGQRPDGGRSRSTSSAPRDGIVLVVVTLTKFTAGWISMLFMAILSSCSRPSIATTTP